MTYKSGEHKFVEGRTNSLSNVNLLNTSNHFFGSSVVAQPASCNSQKNYKYPEALVSGRPKLFIWENTVLVLGI